MSPSPIFPPRRASEIGLLGINRHDLKIGTNHEEIELTTSGIALPSFEYHSSFKDARGRYQATFGIGDGMQE